MARTTFNSLLAAGVIAVTGNLSAVAETTRLEIDFKERAQTVQGWGASLAWWGYGVGNWEEENLDKLVHAIVDPEEGLGLNVFRYNIGGGDQPGHDHMRLHGDIPGYKPQEDGPYQWDADARQVRVLKKLADAAQSPLLEAFSNSPPWWMTHSGCASGAVDGGQNLKREYEGAFAQYLIDVVQYLHDEKGLVFQTLEPMNEPNADWWRANRGQEGCHIPEDQQARLIRTVGKALRETRLPTVVSASDASSLNSGLRNLLSYDEETLNYLGQFNVHSYFGDERVAIREAAAERGLPLWQSETGPLSVGGSGLDIALTISNRLILDMNELQPVVWNIWQVLDTHRRWRHFEVDYEEETFAPHLNGHALRQFTRFIRPGDTIVPSHAENVLAAVSEARQQAILVLVNASSSEREYAIGLDGTPAPAGNAQIFRTSADEAVTKLSDLPLDGRNLRIALAPRSITTVVLPLRQE